MSEEKKIPEVCERLTSEKTKKLQEVEKQILDCHEIQKVLLSIIRVYSNLLLPLQLWPEYETL